MLENDFKTGFGDITHFKLIFGNTQLYFTLLSWPVSLFFRLCYARNISEFCLFICLSEAQRAICQSLM